MGRGFIEELAAGDEEHKNQAVRHTSSETLDKRVALESRTSPQSPLIRLHLRACVYASPD